MPAVGILIASDAARITRRTALTFAVKSNGSGAFPPRPAGLVTLRQLG